MVMQKIFLDSNIFLNLLLKDEFFEGSKKLFEKIENNEIKAMTSLINLMEVLAVLRKKSSKSDKEIIKDVEQLGEMKNLFIIVPNEFHIADAFEIQKQIKTLPTDSILISIARDFSEAFITRDKELQRKAGLFIPSISPEANYD